MKMSYLIADKCRGSALLTVLIVVVIVSSFLGIIAKNATQRGHMARKLGDRVRAQAIAEAGGNKAYSILTTNFDGWSNADLFPVTYYPDTNGTYDATIKSAGTNIVNVICTGRFGIADAVVSFDVKKNVYGTGGGAFTYDTNLFRYVIASGIGLSWAGNGAIIISGSTVICNGEFYVNGNGDVCVVNTNGQEIVCSNMHTVGNSDILADVYIYSNGTFEGKSPDNITGTTTSGPLVQIDIPTPEQMGWDAYRAVAEANNEVYPDGYVIDHSPVGGVIYCQGSCTVAAGVDFVGCIMAVGDIMVNAQNSVSNYTPNGTGYYPTMMAKGDIDLIGGATVTGLLYTEGLFDKQGNGPIYGSVIAGDFNKGGGWDLMGFVPYPPEPPPGWDAETSLSTITAWHQ